jgi:hypothetical protein
MIRSLLYRLDALREPRLMFRAIALGCFACWLFGVHLHAPARIWASVSLLVLAFMTEDTD